MLFLRPAIGDHQRIYFQIFRLPEVPRITRARLQTVASGSTSVNHAQTARSAHIRQYGLYRLRIINVWREYVNTKSNQQGGYLRDLAQMLNAVPKLTTLVCKDGSAISSEIECARYSKAPQDYESTFEHIKTLSIAQLKTMQLLTKFPNLTQLKIESLWTAYSTYRPPFNVVYPTVTELELNAQHGSALESITDSFPGLKTLFVNDMGGTVALRFLDALTENHGVKVILNRDPHNLTALSYVDYFNACGRTPLQYFIEKKDVKKVKEVLTKYTNETYERDLLMRQPQFKFPTRHTYFQSHTSEVKKSSLSNEMIFTLVENGGLGYWSALYLISDVGTVKKTLMLANQHRPVPSEALKAMAKLNCHLSVPVNQIADLVGEDTFKEIATVRDNQGNTLLHLLARKSANLPVYWDYLIPYSDVHALNNKQENAATIAFHARHWMCWQMLIEQGTAIQQEKYIQDLASTRHLLTWILNTATSFRIMKYFRESSSYLQTMFFELQHLTSPRKHFLFIKLIKLGVDPKQYNHHGQSLLNILVEQTANTLIEEWDCIAECDLNLDERDSSGRTPLITAIKLGLLKKAKFLLEKGANPNIHGITARGNKIYPVQLAQTVTDDNVINLLAAHGADFTIEDKNGNTIINAAITKHKFVDVKALAALVSINKPNKHNMTPLAQSICIADLTKVEACLASGADVNQLAGPLLQSPLLLALEADEQAIVRCLLATGRVDVTLKDKAGRSFINYLLRTEPLWEISTRQCKIRKVL